MLPFVSQRKNRPPSSAKRLPLNRIRLKSYRPHVEQLEVRCLLSVDPILEWNAVAIQVDRTSYSGFDDNDQSGPTRSSRALAIEHVAMFDAYNSIHRDFTHYLTQAPNATNASDVAAVAQAAHDTIVALYPHQQALVDTALTQTLRRVPDGARKTRGTEVGRYVARQILAARADDGSQIPGEYIPDGRPGHHAPDPLNPNQGYLSPAWGGVEPFGLTSLGQVPTRPVPYNFDDPEHQPQEYRDAFEQVKRLGIDLDRSTDRTTDQTEIGIFWGYDVARGLGDPPRLYNQIARVVAEQQNNTVAQNARMFALINIAMADAGCQAWGVKYRDAFWRPIVAIQRTPPNQGGDPSWTPLGAPRTNRLPTDPNVNFTPPFPAYTSGHATFGAAMFKTLANFYQTNDVTFSIPFDFISDEFNGVSRDIHDAIPDLILNSVRRIAPRHYTSFSQAAAENAASRIFLGIHWRFDAIEGVSAGDRIADIIFDTRLRPRREHSPTHVPTVDFTAQIDAYLNGTYPGYFTSHGSDPSTAEAFINKVYLDVLGRRAEPFGLAHWQSMLNQGMTRTDVAAAIATSLEARGDQVTDLYVSMLDRMPDQFGLDTFVGFLGRGGTLMQVGSTIMGSPEYFTSRGGSTNAGFLDAAYTDALNRPPDATGAAAFGQQLSTGASHTDVASAILTSAEGRGYEVQNMYNRFLRRDPDPVGANAFFNALETGMSDVMAEAIMIGSDEYASHI